MRTFVNARIHGIGVVTQLSIDTSSQAGRLRLALRDEAEPVDIVVTRYELQRTGDEARLTVIDATASRAWISSLLRQFVVGRPFSISSHPTAAVQLLT